MAIRAEIPAQNPARPTRPNPLPPPFPHAPRADPPLLPRAALRSRRGGAGGQAVFQWVQAARGLLARLPETLEHDFSVLGFAAASDAPGAHALGSRDAPGPGSGRDLHAPGGHEGNGHG